MTPGTAVSSYYFSHPDSRYFGVAEIGLDQASACRSRPAGSEQVRKLRTRAAGPDTAVRSKLCAFPSGGTSAGPRAE